MSTEQVFPQKIQDYNVLQTLGEGVFGKVLHCFNTKTSEVVALKVLKNQDQSDLQREVEMLRKVGESDPSKHNIVKFIDFFTWGGYNCMAFEMLDCSLFDFMRQRDDKFSLSEIRVITQQLLVAFDILKQHEIVHTDLKIDNVMLVNQKERPFKVKLIDFGLAVHKSKLKLGTPVQPYSLRAPEVNLGLPLTEALDMWALGCLLIKMYFLKCPFSGSSPYDNQQTIVDLLGYPSDDLLNRGIYSRLYYDKTSDRQWRLKSPEEYHFTTGMDPNVTKSPFGKYRDLEELIMSLPVTTFPELEDRIGFFNMVRELLDLDYENRITPSEALEHPFITMEYFDDIDHEYVQWARDLNALVLRTNSITTEETVSKSNQDIKEMSPTPNQSSPVHASRKYTFTQVNEATQILTFDDSRSDKDISDEQKTVKHSAKSRDQLEPKISCLDYVVIDMGKDQEEITDMNDPVVEADIEQPVEEQEVQLKASSDLTELQEDAPTTTLCLEHVVLDMEAYICHKTEMWAQNMETDASSIISKPDYVIIDMEDDQEEITDTFYRHVKSYLTGLWNKVFPLSTLTHF